MAIPRRTSSITMEQFQAQVAAREAQYAKERELQLQQSRLYQQRQAQKEAERLAANARYKATQASSAAPSVRRPAELTTPSSYTASRPITGSTTARPTTTSTTSTTARPTTSSSTTSAPTSRPSATSAPSFNVDAAKAATTASDIWKSSSSKSEIPLGDAKFSSSSNRTEFAGLGATRPTGGWGW